MRWWVKLILGLAAIAILCALAVRIGSLTLNVLRTGETTGETDPMFEIQDPTQPPLPDEEEEPANWKDNSANWDQSVHTPVDQSTAELEKEEKSKP